jgi:hypothetical protein
MLNNIKTIEDCLGVFATSSKDVGQISLDLPSDQILLSLARQVKRNVGLTDKQYLIAKDRIKKYENMLVPNFILNLDAVLSGTRLPMRSIDRAKTITLCDDIPKGTTHSAIPLIKIKFPFNRKSMTQLQQIVGHLIREVEYFHEKGTHEHYIKLTEQVIENIITVFGKKDFYIEPVILEMYESIIEVKNSPEKFVPGIFKDTVVNLPTHAIDMIQHELGEINHKTRLVYRDRSLRYGINYYDYDVPPNSLTEKIAIRTKQDVAIENSIDFSKVIESLIELKRAPILVTIKDSDATILDETRMFFNEFTKYFPSSEQSVLFRVDNIPNTYTVNNFIKENFLNNWVDENTKVVYIKDSALPKILITGVWKPITTISMDIEFPKTTIKEYIKHYCDLVVHYDSHNAISKSYRKDKINVIV